MKLLFMTEYHCIGGGERNLLALVGYLKSSHLVKVICPPGDLQNELIKHQIEVVNYAPALTKAWLSFIPLLQNPKVLRPHFEWADIIHCYSINSLPKTFQFRHKTIISIHGAWEKPFGLRGEIINFLAQKIFPVSKDVEKITTTDSNKTQVIYLGLPFSKEHKTLKDQSLTGEDVNLLCLGRFQHIKGQDLLIEALTHLNTDKLGVSLKVDFVGGVNSTHQEDADFLEKVKAGAKALSNNQITIEFHGFRSDPETFLRTADLVIVPSRYESFSLVTIEALSFGIPCIVPQIGGVQEIINSEDIGLKFRAGDTSSLQEALEKGLSKRAQFNRQLCQKRSGEFSIEKQADLYLKNYKETKA